jgi:hypothetical protein
MISLPIAKPQRARWGEHGSEVSRSRPLLIHRGRRWDALIAHFVHVARDLKADRFRVLVCLNARAVLESEKKFPLRQTPC